MERRRENRKEEEKTYQIVILLVQNLNRQSTSKLLKMMEGLAHD